jgi:prepilin-type N-terminal cleavage/methylation domain-containing protein
MIRNIKQVSKNELGFTLIEVMVVIIMVGILAAIAVPIYTNYVYRARTSEAVSTLGAVKTYLMERRNATGSWPDPNAISQEFNGFNELYYFNRNITVDGEGNDDTITVSITPNEERFDPPEDLENPTIWLRIDWANAENGGWGGNIRERWANHLPPAP